VRKGLIPPEETVNVTFLDACSCNICSSMYDENGMLEFGVSTTTVVLLTLLLPVQKFLVRDHMHVVPTLSTADTLFPKLNLVLKRKIFVDAIIINAKSLTASVEFKTCTYASSDDRMAGLAVSGYMGTEAL